MKHSEIIASRDIKTEPGIVVPVVERVIKQEYIEPNPIVNETQSSGIPELHGNIVKNEIIETRRQEERIVREIPRVKPGKTSQFKKAKKNRPKSIEPDPDEIMAEKAPETLQIPNILGDFPFEFPADEMNVSFSIPLVVASHTEKSVIEAKKHRYSHLQLTVYGNCLRITADKTIKGRLIRAVDLKSIDNHEETVKCLVKILTTCEIDTFELSELDLSPKKFNYWPEIEKCAPFRFKTFKSSEGVSCNFRNFLTNCEGVKNILLNKAFCPTSVMINLKTITAIINANVFQMTSKSADFVCRLAQKWINDDADVGDTSDSLPRLTIQLIAKKLGKRVIYKKMNEVRIRTDDVLKHILIRRNKNVSGSLYSCTLIPSNLLESECEKSTWFKELTAQGSAYKDFSDSE